MKILAIMGSSRKNRNTEKFLDIFLDKYADKDDEIVKISLRDLDYKGCTSCYGCAKVPYCIIKDDLTEIYKLIESVDAIVFATPIYFNSVSGLAKNFIDRMQVYWSIKFLQKLGPIKEKIGIALINGGAFNEPKQFVGPELVFDHFFKATTCKRRIFVEVGNTDDSPINEDNEKFMEFLDQIDYDFPENQTYKLDGGSIVNEN